MISPPWLSLGATRRRNSFAIDTEACAPSDLKTSRRLTALIVRSDDLPLSVQRCHYSGQFIGPPTTWSRLPSPASFRAAARLVRGVSNSTGVALVEGYNLDATPASTFGNISTRGFVQTGNNVTIGGFIMKGPDNGQVVLRALGPSRVRSSVSFKLK